MNIMVDRSKDNVIEGTVLTFVNINSQKQVQAELNKLKDRELGRVRRFSESVVETVRESLLAMQNMGDLC